MENHIESITYSFEELDREYTKEEKYKMMQKNNSKIISKILPSK
jgi:hypothetical protein